MVHHGELLWIRYGVKCKRCHFEIPAYAKKAAAIRKWNTRPAEDALKAELTELQYIVEQFFNDWYCEDGCPKQKDKNFPCAGEEENESTAEFYPGECSFYQTKCWVEYYRWKYRQLCVAQNAKNDTQTDLCCTDNTQSKEVAE